MTIELYSYTFAQSGLGTPFTLITRLSGMTEINELEKIHVYIIFTCRGRSSAQSSPRCHSLTNQ